MSHPQPPQRQPTSNEANQYVRAIHNTAVVALVACPILILLPPRKLDFYTFTLGGATICSANFLIRERTGRSIWQHVSRSGQLHGSLNHPSLPPTEQANLQRELSSAEQELRRLRNENVSSQNTSVTEQVQNQRDSWKMQRRKEIQEDVEEGKGFGDMIIGQIWDVWNWGRKGDDEDE